MVITGFNWQLCFFNGNFEFALAIMGFYEGIWIFMTGLAFSTYAPRGVGGVKPPIHFHCVLPAKIGRGGPESM